MSGPGTFIRPRWGGRGFQPRQPQNPTTPVPDKVSIKGPKDLWFTLQVVTKGKTTKTTKAMRLPGGVLICTATVGQIFSSEALCYVPGVDVMKTADGGALVAKAEGQR